VSNPERALVLFGDFDKKTGLFNHKSWTEGKRNRSYLIPTGSIDVILPKTVEALSPQQVTRLFNFMEFIASYGPAAEDENPELAIERTRKFRDRLLDEQGKAGRVAGVASVSKKRLADPDHDHGPDAPYGESCKKELKETASWPHLNDGHYPRVTFEYDSLGGKLSGDLYDRKAFGPTKILSHLQRHGPFLAVVCVDGDGDGEFEPTWHIVQVLRMGVTDEADEREYDIPTAFTRDQPAPLSALKPLQMSRQRALFQTRKVKKLPLKTVSFAPDKTLEQIFTIPNRSAEHKDVFVFDPLIAVRSPSANNKRKRLACFEELEQLETKFTSKKQRLTTTGESALSVAEVLSRRDAWLRALLLVEYAADGDTKRRFSIDELCDLCGLDWKWAPTNLDGGMSLADIVSQAVASHLKVPLIGVAQSITTSIKKFNTVTGLKTGLENKSVDAATATSKLISDIIGPDHADLVSELEETKTLLAGVVRDAADGVTDAKASNRAETLLQKLGWQADSSQPIVQRLAEKVHQSKNSLLTALIVRDSASCSILHSLWRSPSSSASLSCSAASSASPSCFATDHLSILADVSLGELAW
jgi:hypothetical protein